MTWQDIVIAISNILFTYSIFQQVYYGFKKKKGLIVLQNSFLTFIGLYALAIAFFTLNLYFSTIIVTINGTLWFILFLQRLIYEKV